MNAGGKTIGFIGLGGMGGEIAQNLRKAGHALIVFDIDITRAKPLRDAGATLAKSVSELGEKSDVVFTSLPGPNEMRQVGMGEGGLLPSMRSGSAWFDLTTNSPTVVREVSKPFLKRGIELLDAPVSGGPSGARSGQLAIWVGGSRDAFERNKGILDAMGDKVLYVGPLGSGSTAKIVHNYVSLVTRLAIVEGFTLGVKAGMDPLELWHALRQGAIGRTRTFDILNDQYLQESYDPPRFTLRLAHKDFMLAMDLGRELGVPMRHGDVAYQDYAAALERGWSERDCRSAMHIQNERAGVAIKVSPDAYQRTLVRE